MRSRSSNSWVIAGSCGVQGMAKNSTGNRYKYSEEVLNAASSCSRDDRGHGLYRLVRASTGVPRTLLAAQIPKTGIKTSISM